MYDRRNKDEFVSDVFVEGGGGSEDIYGEKEEYYQDGEIATCRDVLAFFFKRSFLSWMSVVVHFVIFVGFVYGYFFGIVLLGAGAEVVGGCQIGSLFENTTNPITYILVGILTTCICQSSTAANFVIGSLVGDILSVQNGIYIMMGANLGNTVINSILVLVHGFNKSELERVVAGASVNDFFFFYAILIFLPLEAVSGILYHLAGTLIPDSLSEGYQWTGFSGNYIAPLVRKIILPNEVLISNIASGNVESCQSMYPVKCEDGTRTFQTCITGIVGCNQDTDTCPFLFKETASQAGDISAGIIAMAIAVAIIVVSIYCMLKVLQKMLIQTPVEVIARITNVNNYIAMVFSSLVTLLVGSSSLTEAVLNPALASGIIEIEQMFPWSLGTNIGMAALTLIQSCFSGKPAFFHVALANLFFNIFAIAVWYPVPFMRTFPLHSSLIVGVVTRKWRVTSFFYVAIAFFGFPSMALEIIGLIEGGNPALKAVGIVSIVVIGIAIFPTMIWWFFGSGKERFISYFEQSKEEDIYENDSLSFRDSASEGTSIEGGSSVGGFEVRYKKKKDNQSNRILNNRAKQLGADNTLRNVKPKRPPPPQARKRLKKSRTRQELQPDTCCTEIELNGCGVGG